MRITKNRVDVHHMMVTGFAEDILAEHTGQFQRGLVLYGGK
jgi:hypothetical protein